MSLLDNAVLENGRRSEGRIAAVDIARGIAVAAMVTYHTAWDLSTLALLDLDVTGSRPWSLFARAIAASFLVLVGIGLVLSHGDGIRWRAFWRRFGIIVAAALAITAGSYLAFPGSYIFFGILHNMAVSSLVALPFVAAPAPLAAAAALVMLGAPLVAPPGLVDHPLLVALGLGRVPPITNDWVPLLPWTGFVLAGIALARPLLRALPAGTGGSPGRALAAMGRHSLLIYLLHQPLIFGALAGLERISGPNPNAEAAPFLRSCVAACREARSSEALCRASCACTVEALREDGTWPDIRSGRASPALQQQAGEKAGECLRKLGPR